MYILHCNHFCVCVCVCECAHACDYFIKLTIASKIPIYCLLVKGTLTRALSRDTEHLTTDDQVCYYRQLFLCFQTMRAHFIPLKGINRTVWGAKLLLTAVLAYPMDYTSICYILKAKRCFFCPNGCFNFPFASIHLPPLTPPPLTCLPHRRIP